MKMKVEFYIVSVVTFNKETLSGVCENVLVVNCDSSKQAKCAALTEWDDDNAKVIKVTHFKNFSIEHAFTGDIESEIKNELAEKNISVIFSVWGDQADCNPETKEVKEEGEQNE